MRNVSARFYLGTLVSSVGSMTLSVCLIASMVIEGYPFFEVGLIVGASRLLPLLINAFLGDLGDHYSPRRIILFSELFAAVLAVALFATWQRGPSAFPLFFLCYVVRASILAIQVGARGRIAKLLSDPSYDSNSRNAIWLNKASQGATLFAGLTGWVIIKRFNFSSAIVFDAITFLLNGLILWSLPIVAQARSTRGSSSPVEKFRLLYKYSPRAALLDLCLALVMCGAGTFNARLAGQSQEWTALFLVSYGIAVWFTGFLERSPRVRAHHMIFWILLGIGYSVLGVSAGKGWLTWTLSLFKDSCYWILFHRISAHIQNDTPTEVMAAVSSARTVQMVALLALGEIAVGYWKTVLPIEFDALWRALICCGVAIALSLRTFEGEVKARAAL